MHDAELRIRSVQHGVELRVVEFGIGASDQHDVCVTEACRAFAQTAQWQGVSIAEGVTGIHKDNIHRALQAQVLESIIQNEKLDSFAAFSKLAGGMTIRSDRQDRPWSTGCEAPRQHCGFVAGDLRVDRCAGPAG